MDKLILIGSISGIVSLLSFGGAVRETLIMVIRTKT